MIKGKGKKRYRIDWQRPDLRLGLILFLLVLAVQPVAGAGPPPRAKLILVNLTRVAFADFDTGNYPHLQQLLTEGQLGLVSVRVTGRLTPEKIYQAVSRGASDPNQGFYPEQGRIGTLLRQAGKRLAFLGNADLPWQVNRRAQLMIGDHRGEVDWAVTDRRILAADPEFPFGFRTDYQKLEQLILELLPVTDLILVETGDLERLEGYRGLLTEERWRYLRAESLIRIDAFLGRLRATAPPGTNLLVFLATPSSTGDGNDLPFPSLLMDQRKGRPGLLASHSTREPGLITIGDLTALLLSLVGQEQGETEVLGTSVGTWPMLAAKSRYWSVNLRQREIILRVYLYLLIIMLMLALVLPFTPGRRWAGLIRKILPALAFLPLTFLLIAVLKITNWPLLVMLLLSVTGALWALACRLFANSLQAYRALLLGTAVLIITDLALGSSLMQASLLGPSPVLGLRFYGLGNEYLGVFLGAFLFGTAAFLLRWPGRQWTGVVLGVIALLIFSPDGGANFGGGVALTYAAWLICRRIQPPPAARKNLLLFALCLGVGFGLHTLWPGASGTTHLHNALQLLRAGAWEQLLAIAVRKFRMNLELINYSPWGYVLLLILIFFMVGIKLTERTTRSNQEKEWYWLGGRIAVRTGLVAFFVNDSGIVVLAPLLLYPLILLAEQWLAREGVDLFARFKQGEKRGVGIGKN
ncbi:MAG TPA: hypothetical protein GXZ98_03670 [Firmicutes bacterium]|nr:hypothetical protein [Bacillota bacterium]